ncbi:MAG: acyl-CoA dehydrogenase family protein [Candidatus Dormiibacterota bacterium]
MGATDSLTLQLREVPLPDDAILGADGFYLNRPGFWFGAMGVAACWWGGAAGAARDVRRAVQRRPDDPHRLAHLGAIAAELEATRALLEDAARRCDDGPPHGGLHRLATTVRAQTAAACERILEHGRAALGSGPLCHDAEVARRFADLQVYISQFRDGAELAELGATVLSEDDPW